MPTFTLQDILLRQSAAIDGNSGLYGQDEMIALANEAVTVINLATGFIQGTKPFLTDPTKIAYPTPAGILFPVTVYYEGVELDRTPLRKMARAYPTWGTDTTAMKGRVQRWTPIGSNYIVITPLPSKGGRYVEVTGVLEPTPMQALTEVISIPNEYIALFDEYFRHRAPLKEGGKIFSDSSVAYQSFLAKLKKLSIYQGFHAPPYYVPKTGGGGA